MELKVWVEGIQRIVCGVNQSTTCQDVVFALAHATGKVGRFTLIERWRNNERLLAPNENPLKILLKWGEYSNDVQFILQRSDQPKNEAKQLPALTLKTKSFNEQSQQDRAGSSEFYSAEGSKQKVFGLSNETKQVDNVGIVKGIPQQKPLMQSPTNKTKTEQPSYTSSGSSSYNQEEKLKTSEFNTADVRSSLDRKTSFKNDKDRNNENILDAFSCSKSINSDFLPQLSNNATMVPPPYRDPPPPRNSPLQKLDHLNNKKFDFKDTINMTSYFNMSEVSDLNDNFFQSAQYKDLIQLIKFQREKLGSQQADLSKYDAEIVYWETKERDHAQQIDALTIEINKTDQIFCQGNEQLQTLQYVEEENELVRQQEKTLKSEITLLRSKLANCETELLQCKNKIRLLLDDIQIEQRVLNSRQKDNRQQMERTFMTEVERIQSEIDQAIQTADTSSKTTDNLKKEVSLIENAIAEKKRQVEQLVNEMKEVNLQSLAVAPSEEIRHLLEGSNKPGSSRRIIGSPRQLENAVPTSKNPHGVWV